MAVKTQKAKNYTLTVGRRREAVARVRLYDTPKAEINGTEYKRGDIVVNGKAVTEYFRFQTFVPIYTKIFLDTNTRDQFIISARIVGGGLSGQADAMIHGIARALDKLDSEKYHKLLQDNGYLTRDPRTRERRKVGTGGKARRKKQSPKR